MSEKVRFYNMTKPVKFRKLKLIFKSLGLTYEVGKERTIYRFNYLLYKLNILKRYSYRDNVEKVIPSPFSLKEKNITSQYFGGIVKMQLISLRDIDIDYFYYERKDGSRKITLRLKDHADEKLFLDSHLDNIHIKVGDQWYDVSHLPVFKMASLVNPEPVAFINKSYIEKPIEPKVVEYDIMKLKTLHHRLLLGYLSLGDISKAMCNYYYECACGEFEKHLNSLTLADIMR